MFSKNAKDMDEWLMSTMNAINRGDDPLNVTSETPSNSDLKEKPSSELKESVPGSSIRSDYSVAETRWRDLYKTRFSHFLSFPGTKHT